MYISTITNNNTNQLVEKISYQNKYILYNRRTKKLRKAVMFESLFFSDLQTVNLFKLFYIQNCTDYLIIRIFEFGRIMVFILEGNSEIGAHVRNHLY